MIKQAVILAAGLGVRLKQRTEAQPKGLIKVGGHSLIDRSLSLLRQAGIEKVFIGTGYLSEFYEHMSESEASISCIKSDRYKTTGSMYTLYNMRDLLNEDFLLLESDLLYERNALAHLLNDTAADIILGSGKTYSGDEVYLQTDKANALEKVSKNAADLDSINAELVGISKVSMERFQHMNHCFEQVMHENPKTDYEYVMAMSSALQPFRVKKIDDLAWCEIDDENHLERAVNLVYPKIQARDHEH